MSKNNWTEQAQKEATDKVFRLAANDASFRQLAITNPRAAVKKATGRDLPEGFNLRFVDPAGSHLTLVLPRASYEEEELAEHELAAVAGGKGGHGGSGPKDPGSSDGGVGGAGGDAPNGPISDA